MQMLRRRDHNLTGGILAVLSWAWAGRLQIRCASVAALLGHCDNVNALCLSNYHFHQMWLRITPRLDEFAELLLAELKLDRG
jgi:hypothetical protein